MEGIGIDNVVDGLTLVECNPVERGHGIHDRGSDGGILRPVVVSVVGVGTWVVASCVGG